MITTTPADGVVDANDQGRVEGTYSGPLTFASSGLPAGLSMAKDGSIAGTPTEVGQFDVTTTAIAASAAVPCRAAAEH